MDEEILLSDVLAKISSELLKANSRAAADGSATMQFEECEIELAINAEKNAKGGMSIWILNASAGIKKTESNTIRLKFKKNTAMPIQAASLTETEAAPKVKRRKG